MHQEFKPRKQLPLANVGGLGLRVAGNSCRAARAARTLQWHRQESGKGSRHSCLCVLLVAEDSAILVFTHGEGVGSVVDARTPEHFPEVEKLLVAHVDTVAAKGQHIVFVRQLRADRRERQRSAPACTEPSSAPASAEPSSVPAHAVPSSESSVTAHQPSLTPASASRSSPREGRRERQRARFASADTEPTDPHPAMRVDSALTESSTQLGLAHQSPRFSLLCESFTCRELRQHQYSRTSSRCDTQQWTRDADST